MASDPRKQSPDLIRFRHPRVVPLEFWDLWVGPRILWETMGEPDFPRTLLDVLLDLRAGHGESRSDGPVPAIVRDFDAVWLGGGGAENAGLREALSAFPCPVHFAEAEAFVGERGGLALLTEAGCTGWVIDLGQTQLKISAAGERRTFPRDFELLPIRDHVPADKHATQRARLREFIAGALRQMSERPDGVVFALPARLDDRGVPEGSSYAGMRGDTQLVPDALALAGLTPRTVFLLNDAELAALSALADPRVSPRERALVLTLGFGLGAALLLPE